MKATFVVLATTEMQGNVFGRKPSGFKFRKCKIYLNFSIGACTDLKTLYIVSLQVRITSTAHARSDPRVDHMNQTISVLKNDAHSFAFPVSPNTKYSLEVGVDQTPPCEHLPTVWSDMATGNCTTPPAGTISFFAFPWSYYYFNCTYRLPCRKRTKKTQQTE